MTFLGASLFISVSLNSGCNCSTSLLGRWPFGVRAWVIGNANARDRAKLQLGHLDGKKVRAGLNKLEAPAV